MDMLRYTILIVYSQRVDVVVRQLAQRLVGSEYYWAGGENYVENSG